MDSKLFEARPENVEDRLNELGSKGWEMVAACGPHGQTFIFKRKLAPAAKTKGKVAD
jgi:hypothetical protein